MIETTTDPLNRWTEEEDLIIQQEVEKFPEHLRNAFFSASKKINRTHTAICTRYYNVILNFRLSKSEQIKKLSEELLQLHNDNLNLKKQATIVGKIQSKIQELETKLCFLESEIGIKESKKRVDLTGIMHAFDLAKYENQIELLKSLLE